MKVETENPPVQEAPHKHRGEALMLFGVALVVAVVLLAIGIFPRLSRNAALAKGVKEAKSSVPEVVVVKPKWVPDSGLSLPGNIEAIKETTINARTTGYVRKLLADIGSHVKPGQVVAVLQAPDMDQQAYQAVAQTNQSRSVVVESQADVDRQRATLNQNKSEVLHQRAAVEQAQAQLAGARATQEQSQASEEGSEAQLTHAEQTLGVQQAALKQAQAQVTLAETTYNRYKGLVAQGFDSQQDLDQAYATYRTNQAAVTSAEAQVSAAQADVVSAQKAVQAAKDAVKTAQANVQASSKNVQAVIAELKATEDTVKYAQESVRVSQATVAANQSTVAANQANQQRYAVMKGFENVTAPFEGVITARGVDVGSLIIGDSAGSNPGTTSTMSATTSNTSTGGTGAGLFGIARIDVVRIQISVPQTYVPALRAGSDAAVSIRELPGKVYHGTIALRAGAMDTSSRTQLVEIHLENKNGELVPGMFAQVRITPQHPPTTLRVPGTVLIVDASGTRVGVVTTKKTLHMQPVVIGRDFGTEVEILDGLKGNERLVNNPSDLLQENEKVQITAAPAGGRGAGGRGDAGAGGGRSAGGKRSQDGE